MLICSPWYPTVRFTSPVNKTLSASLNSCHGWVLSVYNFIGDSWLVWRNGRLDDSGNQVKDLFLPLCFFIPQPWAISALRRSQGCSPRSAKLVCFVVATNLPYIFFFSGSHPQDLPFLSIFKQISRQKKILVQGSRWLRDEDVKFDTTSIYEGEGEGSGECTES